MQKSPDNLSVSEPESRSAAYNKNHMHKTKTVQKNRRPRIGIYAGSFDPVHAGHVAFALQAMDRAGLDQVVFVPERRPRMKPGVEHFAHRVAMLRAALAPHPDLALMEVVDRQFTVRRMLPLLRSLFPDAELVLLMGSDTARQLPDWPYAERLVRECELVIGLRSEHTRAELEQEIVGWDISPRIFAIFDSYAPEVSSAHIRQALRANRHATGLLTSVRRYARQEWLYASPALVTSA